MWLQKHRLKLTALLLLTGLWINACTVRRQISSASTRTFHITDSIKQDTAADNLIKPYRAKMAAAMNSVIGTSAVAMPKQLGYETLIGNFFADAVLERARIVAPEIDFAIPSTNGGIRSGLPAGAITRANIFELMPFENELVVLTLSGRDVSTLIDFVVATGGQPVSGLQVNISAGKAAGVYINNKPINIAGTYKVLTSDYLAGGGDKVPFGKPVQTRVLGLKIRDALMAYVQSQTQQGKAINSKKDGRIRNAN